ncbi:MAG TPA: hypothetical protein VNZ49_06060 [Bacteroidia bacterium]|nr:hypothetical protein [Bacteroidia bacterium]
MNNEIHITAEIKEEEIKKGIYLVLLHANRVPPHIGMMMDNAYHSLSVKGQEINISGDVLMKNISVRKIPTVFIEIKKHPVFSNNHLSESFIELVKQFDKVNTNGNTCLSPVKLFFDEYYALEKANVNLVFDLLNEIQKNNFGIAAFGVNLSPLKENIFYLQPYDQRDLQKQIDLELSKLKK